MKMLDKLIKKLKRKAKPLYRSGRFHGSIAWDSPVTVSSFTGDESKRKDKRKVVKPKEVMGEILAEQPKMDLRDLDKQIKAIEKRRDFMEDDLGLGVSEENKVLNWLKNRKKYEKYKKLFNWNVTTNEEVTKLCSKYQLKTGSISDYKRCIPQEALDEIESFIAAYKKVSKERPRITIIGDIDETKKDPIALGESPFGNWHYVLGAWDKEVEYMEELYKDFTR